MTRMGRKRHPGSLLAWRDGLSTHAHQHIARVSAWSASSAFRIRTSLPTDSLCWKGFLLLLPEFRDDPFSKVSVGRDQSVEGRLWSEMQQEADLPLRRAEVVALPIEMVRGGAEVDSRETVYPDAASPVTLLLAGLASIRG